MPVWFGSWRTWLGDAKLMFAGLACDHHDGFFEHPGACDAEQPIIFMQCGPIRHKAAQPLDAPHDLAVTLITALDALSPDAPRVLLATGKLVGEGFDHPPLDTLVLAMPVSWKGTLQQYAGRLHREHASKTDVRIIDFVDTGHPALLRMWDKRQRGYRAMGYRVDSGAPSADHLVW